MSIKRMRVFAGPNGSGKTSTIKLLQGIIPFGIYVNADDIERMLVEAKVVLFDTYQLEISEAEIHNFFKTSTFSPIQRKQIDLWNKLSVTKNVLHVNTYIDSYLAADLAEFIRQKLLQNGTSFTYETVMSHKGKIDFLKEARENDYKIYLYYVATQYPEINIDRVNKRVTKNGHYVPPEKIIDRYHKSLNNLKAAVKLSNRAYIWDNSKEVSVQIAEITNGETVNILDVDNVPNWFVKYLVN